MQIKLDLATASAKDAEHAIFVIAAYFGFAELPDGFRLMLEGRAVNVAAPGAIPDAATLVPPDLGNEIAGTATGPATSTLAPTLAPASAGGESPAQAFGPSPAEAFGGNAPSPAVVGPQGTPDTPMQPPATVAPSAGIAAGPAGTPATPPAPGASALPGVEVDTDGLPWDNRIHASGDKGAKPKNADGRWRKKRGLNDPAMVARVEAELRATMGAPAPTAGPVPPTPPQPPVAGPTPPQPPQAPAPAAGPLPAPVAFTELMPRITKAVNDKVIPLTALQEACTAYGLAGVPALQQRPDFIPSVWEYLKSQYPALQ